MNRGYINASVGKLVQLRALAIHLDVNDAELAHSDDDWLVEGYSARVIQIKNTRTGSVGLLHDDSVHSFRENATRGNRFGFFVLLAQTFVRGNDVFFEPVARPGERLTLKPHSLTSEALLDATLACHLWKNTFMSMHGEELPRAEPGQFVDVWDLMAAKWLPQYTPETYARYLPLFAQHLDEIRRRLDRVLALFQNVLPRDYQAEIARACRQLEVEQHGYLLLPSLQSTFPKHADPNIWFHSRFVGVIHVLRRCSREGDRRRDELNKRIDGPATTRGGTN